MNDTPLSIKQTLDMDPEINFINWELNVQDVASTTGRTIAGDQGLLGLVLSTAQWESHALNISVNDEGHQVIAQRYPRLHTWDSMLICRQLKSPSPKRETKLVKTG